MIEAMAEMMGKLDATNCSSEEAIVNFILGHLAGYKYGKHINADRAYMITAIQAYAKLLQDHDVKVVA